MILHEKPIQAEGAGSWDGKTGRYIPMGGGSRSRLPIQDDPKIRRYHGLVGIDEHLSESIGRISALYAHIGGATAVMGGKEGEFVQMLMDAKRPAVKPEE